MAIDFAILGLLSWQPMSGYDLKRIFEDSVVYYWSGNNNQIYRTLVSLHQAGLVAREVQPQEHLPARKVYSITTKGREALKDRAASQPELPQRRHAFLLQVAWADVLVPEELDRLLAAYEEEVYAQWKMALARESDGTFHPARTPREALLWEMVVKNWTENYEQELHWVRDLRKRLKNL